MLFKTQNDTLTVFLSGDIDHHTSKDIRIAIDDEIIRQMPQKLELDFKDVNFMDSSGVGLVMGRFKVASNYGCNVYVLNLSATAQKIMRMSGLGALIKFKKD